MRFAKYLMFALWLLATTVALLTPRETVRSTGAAIRRQPAIHAHRGSPVYRSVNDGDNWHLFWYFGLAALIWILPFKPTLKSAVLLLAVLNLFSLATEGTQECLIPGRAFEWGDLLLNAAGIGAGLCTGYVAKLTRKRQLRHYPHHACTGQSNTP